MGADDWRAQGDYGTLLALMRCGVFLAMTQNVLDRCAGPLKDDTFHILHAKALRAPRALGAHNAQQNASTKSIKIRQVFLRQR